MLAMARESGSDCGIAPLKSARPRRRHPSWRTMHTHFLRADTRLEGFVRSREAVGKAGWNGS